MIDNPGERLNQLLVSAGQEPLDSEQTRRFEVYLELFIRWNARMNLSAVRDEEGILSRHFVESIGCARSLPAGITSLLDFGSGGGFPGIPIALCRPEIAVTLAESQGKKASFLQEAVRSLELSSVVHRGRAETLTHSFDCVALRAVDRMQEAVGASVRLLNPAGWLAILTTRDDSPILQAAAGREFQWSAPLPLPGANDRVLSLGSRALRSPE